MVGTHVDTIIKLVKHNIGYFWPDCGEERSSMADNDLFVAMIGDSNGCLMMSSISSRKHLRTII